MVSFTFKTVTAVLQLSLVLQIEAHFLWQQNVKGSSGGTSTLITFGETPGIDNAGEADFVKMAYDKGVHVYINSIADKKHGEEELATELVDKYIEAKLPDSMLSKSYTLEGFCNWGIFSEGQDTDEEPNLLQYYTSASYLHVDSDYNKVIDLSQNALLFFMNRHHAYRSPDGPCKGNHNHKTHCVQAIVKYEGDPVVSDVTFFNGDTGEEIATVKTDQDGLAYQMVPSNIPRVFGRVNHDDNTPGTTSDGESYGKISNWATAVLEIHMSDLQQSPIADINNKDEQATSAPDNTNNSSTSSDDMELSISSIAFIAFMAFIGSFLGAMSALGMERISTLVLNSRQKLIRKKDYDVVNEEIELKRIDEAESC